MVLSSASRLTTGCSQSTPRQKILRQRKTCSSKSARFSKTSGLNLRKRESITLLTLRQSQLTRLVHLNSRLIVGIKGQKGKTSLKEGVILRDGIDMQVEEGMMDGSIQLTVRIGTVVCIEAYQIQEAKRRDVVRGLVGGGTTLEGRCKLSGTARTDESG